MLKLVGNRVNAKIITLLRRHSMSPRDISRYLEKNEADIVRRLRVMEKVGLVESRWGTRLRKNVKLYDLVTGTIDVRFNVEGVKVAFKNKNKLRKNIAQMNSHLDEQPRNTEYLIGRNDELKALSDERIKFFWIAGVAGMGKSSLAEKFSQSMPPDCPTLWHTFKEIDTLTYLLGKIRAFLSVKDISDLDKRLELFRTQSESETVDLLIKALNNMRCLMVFDDFHKAKDEKIQVFLRNLKQRSTNKVLVLSRSKPPFFLDDINSKELVLQGLPLEDARQMISRLGLLMDDDSLLKVWRRFSGQPMALKIFCLFAKERNLTSLAEVTVKELSTINDYFQKEIFEVLGSDEQNILLTLSVFRTPVKSKAFRGITINRRNLGYLLHSLEKRMIVNRTASDKFLVHDILRDILYPMLPYPEDAHASAAAYYLSEGMADDVVEAIYHLVHSQDKDGIFEIIKTEVIDQKYRLVENGFAIPLAEILAQIDLKYAKDTELVLYYNLKGKALSMLQEWSYARESLEKAARLSEKISDQNLLAYSLRNKGESLFLIGDLKTAEETLLDAASILKKLAGSEKALVSIYMILARLYFARGDAFESTKYLSLAKSTERKGNNSEI